MSGARRSRERLGAAVLLGLLVLPPVPASAHSYTDPALTTVLDGVQPSALPAGVSVAVVPSVVDELVVTNPTVVPLQVLATGGEPFLQVDRGGVLANLASPDWYLTGAPEGGAVPPPQVQRDRGRGAPRWARVSRLPTWSEFDPRLHPAAAVSPAQRAAGKDLVLAVWRIPLRYGGSDLAATGHVAFTPVRGAFVTAVTAPAGLRATALQGELPGVLLQVPAARAVVVEGSDGRPFLRFAGGRVEANTASPSWAADQRARGRAVPAAVGGAVSWVPVASAPSYSWLDPRLRYPADLPPPDVLGAPSATVVRRAAVPLTVDGAAAVLQVTDTWVPRAVGTHAVVPAARGGRSRALLLLGLAVAAALVVAGVALARRRRA